MPLHHRLVTVRKCWEITIVVEEVYVEPCDMEACELGGGAANGLPAAGLVPGVVPSGPVLDHSAQKDRRLLAQQGSLGKRRKPSRGSLHTFLSALHRWEPEDDQEDSDNHGEARAPAVSTDVDGSAPPPAAPSASPSGGPAARSSSPPLSTDIDNINEADPKPKPNRTNQQTEINNNNSKNAQNDPKPGVRFISAPKEEGSDSVTRLDVPKKEDVVRTVLGHRRQSSLDSGCSLDMSSSSSSGKGSPDPVAPTLTPPPEFADTPVMERRRRSRRRHTSGTSATPGTMAGSPGVGTYSAVTKVPDSIPRIPRAKESSASSAAKPASPEIQINFRILPRAKARATNAPGTSVSRSESCRTYSKTAGSPVAPAFKSMSWDRHVLSSPSDRYLDDSERRCRSLSRPARPLSSSPVEDARRDPEWLEIARRRQATGVDWENLEARMKQPHSISCSNLSESHLRGKVASLDSADRAGMRLVRSASALYPRIKMSRFERRLRRENPNPSPERRRSSDEFVVVSSSSSDAASASASSTEEEKPSFLNVQLRHVEKAPPLNVVFQTRGGVAGGAAATAVAPEPAAAPRSASPTLTWKSHREDTAAPGTPSPARLAPRDRATGGAGRTRTASETLGVAEYLTPKRVELIEATPAAKKEDVPSTRRSPTRTVLSDHVSRGLGKAGPPLRRSSSVQMRSREVMSAGRASPWDQLDSAITPSWILEAERKKKSGIDWARLDQSLSQSGGRRSANLSSECLHQPTSAAEVVPDWLKEIRRKKEEDASIRLSRSSEDILNEATVIDSATPRPQARSPTEASRKTPPATQKPAEPTTESIAGPSIPPPPPMPPSDFWSKPKEVWFKKEIQKPGAGRIVAPVCQRDSETQTQLLDYGAQVTSPVQAFSPGSLLHAISPFATYSHPFVAPGGNQVLLLDDRGVQLPSGPLYAVPPAAGVFPGTTAILVARDEDRVPKKVAMESKATSTDDQVVPPPSPAAATSEAAGDTKSMLDDVEKKLEEDRKPPDEIRPRTATPGGVSKITTVETTTIMETIESTKVSRRAFDETSLKSICSRSEKEDILSGLSDSPIPFADDDDALEELGYSSHVESRSASRAEEKKEEVVSDEKVTMYSSTRKSSVPQTEPKAPVEVRSVKSPPVKKQVSVSEQRAAATPSPVPSPPRAGTPPRSQAKAPMVNGHRSPPLETSFDVLDRGFHTEPLKKKGPSGVTVLSSSKGESVTSKFQRPSCISPASSSTVTTGPDGTLRGAHARTTAQTLAAATKAYCNGDVRSPLGPFKKTKSMSDSNLGPRVRPTKKATASQATQTPNGVLPAASYERRYFEGGFGGRAMGVQTDDRIESFLRDTLRTSTKEVEFVTKVDSSQPSKTLRKKVTTKILRGSSGKGGGVREIIEEIYDQSSVVVRPSTAIKNVTRSVQQSSDGQKYLTTVITEAPATGRSRRSRRRGFGDPDTHIIMV
ncbi:uncharacterized protein LOC144121069 isoform X3 [Amblyomma americanum]